MNKIIMALLQILPFAANFVIIFLTLLFITTKSFAQKSEITKEKKFLYTNVALTGGVLTYGFINWDYGKNSYSSKSEKWFQSDSKEGGADKTGHIYSAYLTSRLSSSLFQQWGYSRDEAAWRGALTSFLFTSTMEIGDGFSNYGASYEDLISNSLGQVAGYILEINPNLSQKFDLRLEYNPINGIDKDPFTDYNRSKYLIATKFSGFDFSRDNFTKYLEFHFGYYARGYNKFKDRTNTQRNIYAGIGINLSQILNDFSYKKTAKIFNYYQTPYSHVAAKYDFNDHQ